MSKNLFFPEFAVWAFPTIACFATAHALVGQAHPTNTRNNPQSEPEFTIRVSSASERVLVGAAPFPQNSRALAVGARIHTGKYKQPTEDIASAANSAPAATMPSVVQHTPQISRASPTRPASDSTPNRPRSMAGFFTTERPGQSPTATRRNRFHSLRHPPARPLWSVAGAKPLPLGRGSDQDNRGRQSSRCPASSLRSGRRCDAAASTPPKRNSLW